MVGLKVGRRRKPQLEFQRTQVAIGNPLAKESTVIRSNSKRCLGTGCLPPSSSRNQPVSIAIVREGEGGCVAEDVDITNRSLEDAEQIWG